MSEILIKTQFQFDCILRCVSHQHCFPSLLQSFLKELPGSLLVSDLYDSWVSALDNEDPQQRDQEVRK